VLALSRFLSNSVGLNLKLRQPKERHTILKEKQQMHKELNLRLRVGRIYGTCSGENEVKLTLGTLISISSISLGSIFSQSDIFTTD